MFYMSKKEREPETERERGVKEREMEKNNDHLLNYEC